MAENRTDHAHVRLEPIVVLVIHILAVILLTWLVPLPFATSKFLEWLGYALVVLGIGVAVSARSQFVQAHTTRHPSGSVTSIVTGGPYRFSRNPIYLGFLCFLVGFSFIFRSYWGLVLSPVFIALMNMFVIQPEEAYLEVKFKDVYTGYKSRVRRWL